MIFGKAPKQVCIYDFAQKFNLHLSTAHKILVYLGYRYVYSEVESGADVYEYTEGGNSD